MIEVSVVWIPHEWYEEHPSRPIEIVDLGHGMTLDPEGASLLIENHDEWEAFLLAEHPEDWRELATGMD